MSTLPPEYGPEGLEPEEREVPELPELPELPEFPELSEPPETPELSAVPEAPELDVPEAEAPQPELPGLDDDEQEVLRSWADRLEAFRAPEPEPEAETQTFPDLEPLAPPAFEPAETAAAPAPRRSEIRLRRRHQTHKRLVGLKIGSTQIAAATVTNTGRAELVQLAREPLAPGIVVAGEVREPVELGEALKDFFKKHKLPKKDVRLGIAANRIGVRTFDLPVVEDPRQRENAILFRAQEVLPVPVNEAVLDYHILDDETGETAPRVLLVVAYKELVDGFLEACELADITLAGIDLEAFALLRALEPPHDLESRRTARVAVALGHHRSTVAVSDGHVCEFTRVIDWGGDKLDVAIARATGITPQEAAPIKHSLSVAGAGDAGSEDPALEAVLRELHAFTRDLVSSLHFYQSQPGALEISEIVLTGGTAELPGIAEELQRLIGVNVRVADPLRRVRLGKKLEHSEEQLGSLTVAVGLGIED